MVLLIIQEVVQDANASCADTPSAMVRSLRVQLFTGQLCRVQCTVRYVRRGFL